MKWDTTICKTHSINHCVCSSLLTLHILLRCWAPTWLQQAEWNSTLDSLCLCCTKLMERTERWEKQLQNFQISLLCFYWSKIFFLDILSLTAHLSFRRENDFAQQDCSLLGKFLLSFYSVSSKDCSDCKNKSLRLLVQIHCLQMKSPWDLPFSRHFAAKGSWFFLWDELISLSDCSEKILLSANITVSFTKTYQFHLILLLE